MNKICVAIATTMLFGSVMFGGQAGAAPPPGFLHVDATAGCVFGNAPHHSFKPAGNGVFFGLVFETDEVGASPVTIEIALNEKAYQKLDQKTRKFYHNHADEVRMGEVTLPDLQGEEADKMLKMLAATYGRMILISEIADSGPHERTHIPTEARDYIGTFWSYSPKK
ncbi:MAG: DUF1264 domain-containing protein [SAR324 cluster bacterium]|nr:DUF1264 domain-containing protein [SAR324 cluster bacterium]